MASSQLQVDLSVKADQIVVSRNGGMEGSQSLTISLQRTVRVADNSGTSRLPPGFGELPIYDAESFKANLPEYMACKGGFFAPIYRNSSPLLFVRAES